MNTLALNVGTFCGPGPLGLCNRSADQAPGIFNNVISMIIGIMSVIAGIWFIFILVTGAVSLITSAGDKQAVEAARNRVTTGLIGLVIVIAAIFILDLVGGLIGIDILNPAEFIIGTATP